MRNLRVCDTDIVRGMLHVKQGKGSKDRCIPFGKMLSRGIAQYIDAEHPRNYLFEGNGGEAMSQRVMGGLPGSNEGIRKEVHTHTLRHSAYRHTLFFSWNLQTQQH